MLANSASGNSAKTINHNLPRHHHHQPNPLDMMTMMRRHLTVTMHNVVAIHSESVYPCPPYSHWHGFQVTHRWQRHGNQMMNDDSIVIHHWPFSTQRTVSPPSPIHLMWPTNRQWHNGQQPSTTPRTANMAQHHHPRNGGHKWRQQPNTTPWTMTTAQYHPTNGEYGPAPPHEAVPTNDDNGPMHGNNGPLPAPTNGNNGPPPPTTNGKNGPPPHTPTNGNTTHHQHLRTATTPYEQWTLPTMTPYQQRTPPTMTPYEWRTWPTTSPYQRRGWPCTSTHTAHPTSQTANTAHHLWWWPTSSTHQLWGQPSTTRQQWQQPITTPNEWWRQPGTVQCSLR